MRARYMFVRERERENMGVSLRVLGMSSAGYVCASVGVSERLSFHS